MRVVRWTLAIGALATLGLGCTSPKPEAATDSSAGVADESVTISLVVADLSLLTDQNLAPDLGDPIAVGQAVVDDINENGGAGGRQLELTTHVIEGLDNFTAEGGRQACLAATQEDHAFVAVITPAVIFDVASCLAVQNKTLTMSMASWDQQLYDDAEGRLFAGTTNVSVGIERAYRAWPGMLQQVDALPDDATIGIVRADLPPQTAATENGLKPALEDLGFDVAVDAVLPCGEGTGCAQQDVAIQKMKDAGVDYVFLIAPATLGVDVVQAAVDLDFHPEWTTIGENVTDTVAQFYAPVKDEWDGAWGIDTTFSDRQAEAAECNKIVSDRIGLDYDVDSDQYGFAAVVCLEIKVVADAISKVDGDLTQASFIDAMESMSEVPSAEGPRGSFGPDKHDAGDYQFVSRYSADEGVFVAVDETPQRAE